MLPSWADEIIGGWQVTTLYTFRTGQPAELHGHRHQYNTNYLSSSLCMLAPGLTSLPGRHGLTIRSARHPEPLCAIPTSATTSCPGYAGQVGTRGIMRGLAFWNDDMAVSKFFKLPKEDYAPVSSARKPTTCSTTRTSRIHPRRTSASFSSRAQPPPAASRLSDIRPSARLPRPIGQRASRLADGVAVRRSKTRDEPPRRALHRDPGGDCLGFRTGWRRFGARAVARFLAFRRSQLRQRSGLAGPRI